MAIYHLTHRFVRRSNGSSSIATAAYNAGQKLEDNAGSTEYTDYTRKDGILYDEITVPSGSPAWASVRGELWRRLEARENRSTRRADAVLAHNFNVALPHELPIEQNMFLVKDFIREQFIRKGYVVDWAIRSPDPRGDSRNIHLHILVPLRKIEGESFGNKVHYTKPELRAQTVAWRKSWASLTNRHLKRYGHKAQIDERSLKDQGVKRRPTRHKGPRSKSTRYQLNKLRAKQPPQPIAPIVRMTKQIGADGSITIQRTIKHSALNNIRTNRSNTKPLQANPHIQRKGWPAAAILAWETWGSKEPIRFFTVWPELRPDGFIAATTKGPAL